MRGRLVQALIFLSSRSSESDKSYKKRMRQKGQENCKTRNIYRPSARPPASILLSFRTRTEVFFDDRLTPNCLTYFFFKFVRRTGHDNATDSLAYFSIYFGRRTITPDCPACWQGRHKHHKRLKTTDPYI